MTEASIRIQLMSDRESIDALSSTAIANGVTTEPHEVAMSDQRFGLIELAAIIAIVHTATQIADLLVKTYKNLRDKKKITVTTPKGSVTIEGDSSTEVEFVLKEINAAGIL